MKNVMIISGHRAVVRYDSDTEMFHGTFTGLNTELDFHADNVKELRKEGENLLQVFLSECQEQGIEPLKSYSGKFQVRLPEALHKHAVHAAMANGQSLNQFVVTAIERHLSASFGHAGYDGQGNRLNAASS